MDILNNLSVVVSIVVGLFGIGGYIVGIVAYLRHKVTSSQQHITQPQSYQRNLPQTAQRNLPQAIPLSLSKLDWMWILWNGLEDCFHAKNGTGWVSAGFIGVFGGLLAFYISLPVGILFLILFSTALILFYVYFVGRRIEKTVEEKNQTMTKKSTNTQTY